MNDPSRNLAWLAKQHFGVVRAISFAVCLCPALWLAAESIGGSLGVNPLNRLLHFSGRWALILLLVTLAVTPARRFSTLLSRWVHARYGKRLSDWNWLIRLHRQLRLFAFFYASLHMAIYATLDAGLTIAALQDDVLERPFIVVGFVTYTILFALALTSTQAAMRAMGRAWKRLHTLVYVAALLAVVHFWVQSKVGVRTPLPYSVVLALLLGARWLAWRLGDRRVGVEVAERVHGAGPGAPERAAPARQPAHGPAG